MPRGDKIEPQASEPVTNKRGPKFKLEIDEDLITQIEKYSALGLTPEAISYMLDIGTSSFKRYKKNSPEIVDAIARGRAKGLATSSSSLMKRIQDGDIAAIKWYEQTRHNLSEKIKNETELTVKTEPFESWLRRSKDEKEVISTITDSSDSSSTDIQDGEGCSDDKSGSAKA